MIIFFSVDIIFVSSEYLMILLFFRINMSKTIMKCIRVEYNDEITKL